MPVDTLTVGSTYEMLCRMPTRCCPHTLYPGQYYRIEAILTTSSLIVSEVSKDGQPMYGERQGHLIRLSVFKAAARSLEPVAPSVTSPDEEAAVDAEEPTRDMSLDNG